MIMHKCIRTDRGFVTFPEELIHEDMFDGINGNLMSAGFIATSDGSFVCIGESLSLEVESRGDDTEALHKWLGLIWKA